jgi:hypothetical protein
MSQTFADFQVLQQAVNLEIIDLLERNNVSLAAASSDVVVTQKAGNP